MNREASMLVSPPAHGNLSPGSAADILAAVLFINELQAL
jgi:hypothetical protein